MLLHGTAMQLTDWHPRFLAQLTTSSSVLAFDLRDSGKSTKLGTCADMAHCPTWDEIRAGKAPSPPYSLFDVAEDVLRALDRLEIQRAHMVGYSMGAMAAQLIAAVHSNRVLSLTSLMSSFGQAGLDPSETVCRALSDAFTPFESFEEAARTLSYTYRAYFGPGETYDQKSVFDQARRGYQRSYCPNGVLRQVLAIYAAGDRRDLLRQIVCPTLVIHGSEDQCIDVDWARAAAELVPHCSIHTFEGMGHELTDPDGTPNRQNGRTTLCGSRWAGF